MKRIPLSTVKDDLSRYLREAATQDVLITRHGRPAGVLIGFKSEDDWFDYQLENDPRFLNRIEKSRQELRHGKGIPIEKLQPEASRNGRTVRPARAPRPRATPRRRRRI